MADTILEAERLGFDSVWTAEAYGSDALLPLAWWGSETRTIKLGTSIIQMSARTPAATAMAAMTLDHLSGGRFILGLGVSGPQVVEGWYGQPFAKPLARTREYVDIMRKVLAREGPVEFEGEPTAIQDLFLAGKRAEAMAAVPTRLVEAMAMIGPVAKIREEKERWTGSLATTLVVSGPIENMRTAAEIFL